MVNEACLFFWSQGLPLPSPALWQARCAVLALLANYLHQSPAMQLKSVRDWDMVAALFELLWEEKARRIALRLVSVLSINISYPPAANE